MRHEQLSKPDTFTRLETDRFDPITRDKAFTPAAAARDVPVAVGGMIAASYIMLVATFALATTGSAYSHFIIAIDAVFLIAFFAIPWIFLKLERPAGRVPRLDEFLRNGIDTFTGHSSGPAALVQMLIVPVLLTLGAAAMGVAAALLM